MCEIQTCSLAKAERVKGGMSLWNGMWNGLRNDLIMRNVILMQNDLKK